MIKAFDQLDLAKLLHKRPRNGSTMLILGIVVGATALAGIAWWIWTNQIKSQTQKKTKTAPTGLNGHVKDSHPGEPLSRETPAPQHQN